MNKTFLRIRKCASLRLAHFFLVLACSLTLTHAARSAGSSSGAFILAEGYPNPIRTVCNITWVAGSGSPNSLVCLQGVLVPIRFATEGATGALVSGLPSGLTGFWSNDTMTISGTPVVPGTYTYTITLTGVVCSSGSSTANGSITVQSVFPSAPNLFTSSPSLCPGDTAELSVVPASQFLVYRWFKQGQPVAGPFGLGVQGLAGSRLLVTDSGNYTVLAENSAGCISPQSNGVTVALLPGVGPSILAQPMSANVPIDDTAFFEVQATAYDTIQWEYQPVPGSPWLSPGPSASPFLGPSNFSRFWVLAGSPSLSGYRFRARLSALSRCVQDLRTQEVTLTVLQPWPMILRLDTVVRCSSSGLDTMELELRADRVNRVALAQFAVVKDTSLGWIAMADRNPSLFALNTQLRGDTLYWSGFGNSTPALPTNSLLFRLKFLLPLNQTGFYPVRWLNNATYLSDAYQGSWNLALSDGGVEAVPALPPLQISRQYLGGQYTDTLMVTPVSGAVVTWFLNQQPLNGGGQGRLYAVLGGDYTAVQRISSCFSQASAPFRVDPVGLGPVLDAIEPLVYPNPVQNSLDWVRLWKALEGKGMQGPFEAKIVGMNGALVASTNTDAGDPRPVSNEIIEALSPGLYVLLVLDSRGEKALFRFLKS